MNESAKWRKFLQPLVGALALLIAAATAAIQKNTNGDVDSRITALEVKTQALNETFKSELPRMNEAISTIRSDVSFIRGKLERN